METITLLVRDGRATNAYSSVANSSVRLSVIDEEKLSSLGYSMDEIMSFVEAKTSLNREINFEIPVPESKNEVTADKMSMILRRIENAISEIDALRERGLGFDAMRPSMQEAWWKLHAAHFEYRKKYDAVVEKKDSGSLFRSVDASNQPFQETGKEIAGLLANFIKNEFEWYETTPFAQKNTEGGMMPGASDCFRAYALRGNSEGWIVTVEAFDPEGSGAAKQILRAKTPNQKAAHKLAEIASNLLNDQVHINELDRVNTTGAVLGAGSAGISAFAKIASSSSLENAVNTLVSSAESPKQNSKNI